MAAEFHVDATRGSDAGNGSGEHPWRTLSAAARQMGQEATCIVLQGINDNVKDGKPDLGAHEYGSPPWQAGATVTLHQP